MDPNIYDLEDYFKEKYTKDIVNKIKNLELPPEWKPNDVISYIVRKIEGQ